MRAWNAPTPHAEPFSTRNRSCQVAALTHGMHTCWVALTYSAYQHGMHANGERRSLEGQLERLWGILWATAAQGLQQQESARQHLALQQQQQQVVSGSVHGAATAMAGMGVAVAAARSLVRAFQELRQIEGLLGSLFRAMQGAGSEAAPAGGSAPGPATAGAGGLEAAGRQVAAGAALVAHPAVLQALGLAVKELPTGGLAG